MQRVREFCRTKYFTWLLIVAGALGIVLYYAKNIPYINTVWELVDEYGYLVNAAYLSGKDWGYFTNYYYGFGYSLWLVPLFWLASNAMQVIKGAVLINTMFIVFSFLVQNLLMRKLFPKWNQNMIVLVAFVSNFYPYLITSNMKVIAECLLTFMIWLCGLLLYQALVTEKWYYFILTGIALAYTFFVHTRAFVFLAAVFLLVAVMVFQKKIKWKNLVLFLAATVVFFILGYALKNRIIDVIYSNELFQEAAVIEKATVEEESASVSENMVEEVMDAASDSIVEEKEAAATESTMAEEPAATAGKTEVEITETEITVEEPKPVEVSPPVRVENVLTVSGVIQKLVDTLLHITPTHIYSLICKVFYLFVGTAGMFHVGVYVTLKDTWQEWKEKRRVGAENGIKVMYAIAACVMALALTVNFPGSSDKKAYIFYGRYYEYLIGPMLLIGLGYFMSHKVRIREIIGMLLMLAISFYFTLDMANSFEMQEFYFDSNRLSAFSFLMEKGNYYYRSVIRYSTLFIFIVSVLIIVLNRMERTRIFIPGILLVVFLLNGNVILDNTLKMQSQQEHYYNIAAYLHSNCEQDEIYFVNGDEIEVGAYAGLQSLLLNQKLILIRPEDMDIIESGEWFVTLPWNTYAENYEYPLVKITENNKFVIWQKKREG